jgi:acyl-CoA dehydrogenase
MDFSIHEDLQALAAETRAFVDQQLEPLAQQVEDRDEIPAEIGQEMAARGYFGIPFPKEYGGRGAGELGYCLFLEQLGRTNAAYSNLIGASCGLCGMTLWLSASEEQKSKYLLPIATGKSIGGFCLTEPLSGSDAASLRTTAERSGDAYLLNGTKVYTTNGPIADVLIVMATVDRSLGAKGVTAFIVETKTPGFKVLRPDRKMGLRGSVTGTLKFDDCAVPAENMIMGEGWGFIAAMRTLDIGRISLAAGAVGAAQKALEMGIAYAKQRVTFERPLIKNQAIQWPLAESAMEIHLARLGMLNAAWRVDQGDAVTKEAAMVKLFASEMAGRVIDRVLQIHGGLGYMKESAIERMYRDARILRIYEGTNEVQHMVIGSELFRDA